MNKLDDRETDVVCLTQSGMCLVKESRKCDDEKKYGSESLKQDEMW